ncbi:MAG: TRAP transporter substrate-binding protein [Bacteroidota bacterium]
MRWITLGLLLLTACSSSVKQKRIKLGHGLPVKHPVHQAMVHMGDRLEDISEGQLALDIYPSEQLGTERQCLELLQIGALGMTKVSAAVMENFSPNIRVFGLPYMFRDREHHFQVLDGPIGQQLMEESTPFYLRGLCYFDAGSRSFYASKQIESPLDLDGLKIRVMESQTAIQLVNTLGGRATPLAYGELYSALQQGMVDGAENNPPSFYQSRHYEVSKFYSLDEHSYIPDILVISTHVWDDLSKEEKSWLEAATREAVVFQRKLWAEAEKEALDAVQAAGVTVIRPDKSTFVGKLEPLMETYKEDALLSELIEAIQAVGIDSTHME